MDSQSEERELTKVSAMVQSIRESSRRYRGDREQVREVREEIAAEEQKVLQSELRITEAQLEKARENTAMLMAKLSEREEQIQLLEQQIHVLTLKLDERQAQPSREESLSQSKSKNKSEAQEAVSLRTMELQIARLQEQLDQKDLQLQRARLQSQSAGDHSTVSAAEDSKALLLLEITDLRATVQRLVRLLKLSGQFNAFIQSVQDGKGAHYLRTVCKRIKSNQILLPRTLKVASQRTCSCMDIRLDEKYLWAPLDAYRQLSEIKRKYQVLDEDCIEEILFALNQVWSAREDAHVRRIREHYEAQLGKLKRQRNAPFDQILARKQIQRLKKDVSRFKRQKSLNNPTKSYELFRERGRLDDQVRSYARQVKYLEEKLSLKEKQTVKSEKGLMMEGAAWMGKRVMLELSKHKEEFVAFEDQFGERVEQGGEDVDWVRLYKWLFEGAEELNHNLYEKVRMMQATAQSKAKG